MASTGGDASAHLALDVHVHNHHGGDRVDVRPCGGLAVLVFTGEAGENATLVRTRASERLAFLGVQVDDGLDADREELQIAAEVRCLLDRTSRPRSHVPCRPALGERAEVDEADCTGQKAPRLLDATPRRDTHMTQPTTDRHEQFTVDGEKLLGKVRQLLHEGNVRRIILKREDGTILLEIPLQAGVAVTVVTVALAPVLVAVGAIAALLSSVTIAVERDEPEETDEPERLAG